MSAKCYFHYNFHPIGQGLFASGQLDFCDGRRRFHWVYDCGSMNRAPLQREVRRWQESSSQGSLGGAGTSLDLMVLSHFDEDHLSGIGQLLNGKTLDWLVLPYLTPAQRLLVGAVAGDNDPDPNFFRFLIDPVDYLLTIPTEIRNIVFILPGGELPEPHNPESPVEIPPEGSVSGFEKLPSANHQTSPEDPSMRRQNIAHRGVKGSSSTCKVFTSHGGIAFEVLHLWEFCFFNLDKQAEAEILWRLAEPDYLDFFNKQEKARNYDQFIRKLKGYYLKAFGKGPKHRNDISLVTYTGPLSRHVAATMLWSPWPGENLPMYYPSTFDVNKVGMLYCGDITMTSGTQQAIKGHFGDARWKSVQVLQVPHHGSRDSWTVLTPDPWPQSWSVFCSARNSRYGHPHEEVVSDLVDKSPVFVNEFQGAHWGGTINLR